MSENQPSIKNPNILNSIEEEHTENSNETESKDKKYINKETEFPLCIVRYGGVITEVNETEKHYQLKIVRVE